MAEKEIEGWEPQGAMEEYKGHKMWDHSDFAPDRKNLGKPDPDWKVDPEADEGDETGADATVEAGDDGDGDGGGDGADRR
jgi:hypothetical protein